MGIFNEFFKKEKPVFTGITRGIGGFGFGGGGAAGGGGGPIGFTIKRYSTSNVLQTTTPYSDVAPGTTFTHADAGYYTLEVDAGSGSAQLQMWAWGGGGGTAGGPGPGYGGAAGGVRGTHTISGGDTITFLVGGGGANQVETDGLSTSFPDGGNSVDDSYIEGPGGGRSSIYDGLLPYANRDATPNTFLLIGGGGGGGSHYSDTGTLDARGGYPSGFPGGGYYPSDSSDGYGKGGTQSAGGAGGAAGRQPAGSDGAKYDGGTGTGGAGGGGYYGGGGAGGYYAMGGGGSGYIHPSLTNTASFTAVLGDPNQHFVAVDDPSNPGIKPATAGDSGPIPQGGADGVVVFKVL